MNTPRQQRSGSQGHVGRAAALLLASLLIAACARLGAEGGAASPDASRDLGPSDLALDRPTHDLVDPTPEQGPDRQPDQPDLGCWIPGAATTPTELLELSATAQLSRVFYDPTTKVATFATPAGVYRLEPGSFGEATKALDDPGDLRFDAARHFVYFHALAGQERGLYRVSTASPKPALTTAADALTNIAPRGEAYEDGYFRLDLDRNLLYFRGLKAPGKWSVFRVALDGFNGPKDAVTDALTDIDANAELLLLHLSPLRGELYFSASRGCGFGTCQEFGLFRVGPATSPSAPLSKADALTDTRQGNYHNDFPSHFYEDLSRDILYFRAITTGDDYPSQVYRLDATATPPLVPADGLLSVDRANGTPDCWPQALDALSDRLYVRCDVGGSGEKLFVVSSANQPGKPVTASEALTAINPGGSDEPDSFHLDADRGRLYFVARDAAGHRKLYCATGSTTKLQAKDAISATFPGGDDAPTELRLDPARGYLYFAAQVSATARRLFVYRGDCTPGKAVAASDAISATHPGGSDAPRDVTVDRCTGDVYFSAAANDGAARKLFRRRLTDKGPVSGAQPFFESRPGGDDAVSKLVAAEGVTLLLWTARNPGGGTSLYAYGLR